MLDLRSKARQRLLAYYFTNPTARHHLRDLAARLSIDPSNLSKELRRLEREGLFQSEVSGRQKYFQFNREYPLFDEVRSIVAKTIGVVLQMQSPLRNLKECKRRICTGRSRETSRTPRVTLMSSLLATRKAAPWRKKCANWSGDSDAKSTTRF